MNVNNENLDWRIWDQNDPEERTYLRAKGQLPEMESAKQLRQILGNIDDSDSVLDVGCAAGHYLRSIRKLSAKCRYTGVDATLKYIESALDIHKLDKNANFIREDIYSLKQKADLVFCCNVLLHLPNLRRPLENLLYSFNKKLVIRTLLSEGTHLSQYLYSDDFDGNGNPTNFVFQNTYSYKYVERIIKNFNSKITITFQEDVFDPINIQQEWVEWKNKQGFGTTSIIKNIQISGNKVFRWGWIVCTK